MKTVIHLLFTFAVSTMCLLPAIGNPQRWLLYIVTIIAWAWFFWTLYRKLRRNGERVAQEELFQEYMRSKIRRDQHY